MSEASENVGASVAAATCLLLSIRPLGYDIIVMKCPACGAKMQEEGLCPSCGHLVIGDDTLTPPSEVSGKCNDIVAPLSHGVARGRDYSAALLGMFLYLIFFFVTIVLMMRSNVPFNVAAAVVFSVALSFGVTRLLCRVEPPETAGTGQRATWIIRNEPLRRLMTDLNALWFG